MKTIDASMRHESGVAKDRSLALRNLAIFMGAVLAIGFGIAAFMPNKPPADLAEEQASRAIESAEGGVTLQLRDPGSARFRSVIYRKSLRGPTVCGFVNAKNGFGGYAGYKPFFMPIGSSPQIQPSESASEYYLRESFDHEFRLRCQEG